MNENDDENIPCQWMYTLEGKCKEKDLLYKIMFISAIFYGLLALKIFCFMLWRAYLRRVEKSGYASLDYMLVFAFLFDILRSFDNLVVVHNLFSKAIIFRASLFAISWIPGSIVIYLYLAVVFRTIPKLSLHRLTNNENTLWILNAKKINPVLWSLSSFTSFGLISSSCLAGYFLGQKKLKEMIAAFSVEMFFFLFINTVYWASFIYYGRALVKLTKESLTLAGMDDERKKLDKKKFDIYITKVKKFRSKARSY
ncbi:hypothetical protein RclHR1_05680015 [Rhizophagus clarus]|uniref:G-protein coupled receptors family 1 profile domain-containing protein n=1 Tax=Rhizophagus clarus TaxID=94130 RepID=A0A2Z6S5L4_9GLOM|nr:hypothetical protein RclHR1_05680015 [Rhizophagus clarus]